MVGNLLWKTGVPKTSMSRADCLLIGGIVAGIALFWLLMVAFVMRLVAALG